MMDITSYQSIEQRLTQLPFQPVVQKSEYVRNLKSECLYKQNALKTAENLIEEYYRQNQQLKIQVAHLHQKIQNYEEIMGILKHQVETKQISSVKSYQKQLFKSSFKLSKVLEKYSQLQQKYHTLQKQFTKLKDYKKQNEQKIVKQRDDKQRGMKKQIQKQFNSFLRTPVNKSTNVETNASTNKKSFSKSNNSKKLHINDFESESDENINCKYSHKGAHYSSKQSQQSGNELFHRSQSINKSANKTSQMQRKQRQNCNTIQTNVYGEQQELFQKLRILEWKIKEKDEQIMLMLRRNKQIESKYSLLKEILQKHKQPSQLSEDSTDRLKEESQRKKRTLTQLCNPKQITTVYHQTEVNQGDLLSAKTSNKNVVRLNSSFNNITDITTWKNLQTYKYH